jgi:choline dehydrogenase-like flavoprotein
VVSRMAHPSLDCPAKGQPLLSTSGGFSLADSQMDDGARVEEEAGSSLLTGFSVMRSPDRCLSRWAEGSQVERLWIDSTDAPMPWLREAEKLSNSHRVSFASTLNLSPGSK